MFLIQLEQQVREQQAREFRERQRQQVAEATIAEAEAEAAARNQDNQPSTIEAMIAALPEETAPEIGDKKVEEKPEKKEPSPSSSTTTTSTTKTEQPNEEEQIGQDGVLGRALQKSETLLMLEETAKARKAREDDLLRMKRAKEFMAQKQAAEEAERKWLVQGSKGDVVANRRAAFEQQISSNPITTSSNLDKPTQGRPKVQRRHTFYVAPRKALRKEEKPKPTQSKDKKEPKMVEQPKTTETAMKPGNVSSPPKQTGTLLKEDEATAAQSVVPGLPGLQRRHSIQTTDQFKAKPKLQTNANPEIATTSSPKTHKTPWLNKRNNGSNANGTNPNYGGVKNNTSTTAAQNALKAQQRRWEELQAIQAQSIVGANDFSKREMAIVKLQAMARQYLVQTFQIRQERHAAATLIQAPIRGMLVRMSIKQVQDRIVALEDHLQAMEQAKQEELEAIWNSLELIALQDQADDTNTGTTQLRCRNYYQEKAKLQGNIQSVQDHSARIAENMEQLRVNNKQLAKETRDLEWKNEKQKDRNATKEKTRDQLKSKVQEWQSRLNELQPKVQEAIQKATVERAVGKICSAAIFKIEEHTKQVAATSNDPFLIKVHRRSQILDRLSAEKKRAIGAKACPMLTSR